MRSGNDQFTYDPSCGLTRKDFDALISLNALLLRRSLSYSEQQEAGHLMAKAICNRGFAETVACLQKMEKQMKGNPNFTNVSEFLIDIAFRTRYLNELDKKALATQFQTVSEKYALQYAGKMTLQQYALTQYAIMRDIAALKKNFLNLQEEFILHHPTLKELHKMVNSCAALETAVNLKVRVNNHFQTDIFRKLGSPRESVIAYFYHLSQVIVEPGLENLQHQIKPR